jgi:hypothetical protein
MVLWLVMGVIFRAGRRSFKALASKNSSTVSSGSSYEKAVSSSGMVLTMTGIRIPKAKHPEPRPFDCECIVYSGFGRLITMEK